MLTGTKQKYLVKIVIIIFMIMAIIIIIKIIIYLCHVSTNVL